MLHLKLKDSVLASTFGGLLQIDNEVFLKPAFAVVGTVNTNHLIYEQLGGKLNYSLQYILSYVNISTTSLEDTSERINAQLASSSTSIDHTVKTTLKFRFPEIEVIYYTAADELADPNNIEGTPSHTEISDTEVQEIELNNYIIPYAEVATIDLQYCKDYIENNILPVYLNSGQLTQAQVDEVIAGVQFDVVNDLQIIELEELGSFSISEASAYIDEDTLLLETGKTLGDAIIPELNLTFGDIVKMKLSERFPNLDMEQFEFAIDTEVLGYYGVTP